jgi:hypothetical protein
MDRPEFGDLHRRPELPTDAPAKVFSYAQQKIAWLKERVSSTQMPDAVDLLVEELQGFITQKLTPLPGITVQASEVYHTQAVSQTERGTYVIKSLPLELEGDAKIYGEHTIEGTLYGFHRGEKNDLRVFVDRAETPITMRSGIYQPLLSIPVEKSVIRFTAQQEAEQLQEKDDYITTQLETYPQQVRVLIIQLINALNSVDTPAKKLHNASDIIAGIASYVSKEESYEKFIDAVLDYIHIKLGLASPQDITTSSHQVVISERPTSAYRRGGPASFDEVTPQLGVMGESANRVLGLIFPYKNEESPVTPKYDMIRIPVQAVTILRKSNPPSA